MQQVSINSNKKNIFNKLALWTAGFSSYYIFTWIYDYAVVSSLIWFFGPIEGGLFVLLLSIFVDFFTLKFYDWFKKDWLALETLKDIEQKSGFMGKIFNFIHNKAAPISVLILSIFTNPFVVTAYMRKGANEYNGISKRDWYIFFSSAIISNGFWVIVVSGGVSVIKNFISLF